MMLLNRTASLELPGIAILNLRTEFTIQKIMSPDGGGKSEIKIYNLSPAHRNAIETNINGQDFILRAGYGGFNKMLFSGKSFYVTTERTEADYITTCQVMQGAFDQAAGIFIKVAGANNAYEVYQIVLAAFQKVGIAQGYFSKAVQPGSVPGTKSVLETYKSTKFPSKFSDLDTGTGMMNKLALLTKTRVNIADGRLNVFADWEYQDAEIIYISKKTGMIGNPSKMQDGNYKVKCLLDGDIEPGKRVRVSSDVFTVNGDLRVISVTHTGDTQPISMGAAWYTDIEASVVGTAPGYVEQQ